jgi:hypothetical protein
MDAAPTESASVEELVELDEGVAERAGDGRAAGRYSLDERLDHALFELALQIDNVIRHADVLGHAPGVVDIVERAAAAGGPAGRPVPAGGADSRAAW